MIESQDDKARGNPFHWKDNEKFHWNRFLNSKNLFDPIAGNRNLNLGIWHTWCNFQQGQARIYSRLDRFYADKHSFSFPPDQFGNIVQVTATTLSDHHPIFTRVNFIKVPMHNKVSSHNFILNSSFLKDEDVLVAIQIIRGINKVNLHHLSNLDRWNLNLPTWKCFLQTTGQKRAKDYRFVEKQLCIELQRAESSIQETSQTLISCLKSWQLRTLLGNINRLKFGALKLDLEPIGSNLDTRVLNFFSISLNISTAKNPLISSLLIIKIFLILRLSLKLLPITIRPFSPLRIPRKLKITGTSVNR